MNNPALDPNATAPLLGHNTSAPSRAYSILRTIGPLALTALGAVVGYYLGNALTNLSATNEDDTGKIAGASGGAAAGATLSAFLFARPRTDNTEPTSSLAQP